MRFSKHLENFTHRFAKWAGSAGGFVFAGVSVIGWLAGGWLCKFSAPWESGITVYYGTMTFLLVFLIQRGQNKEVMALQVKLNELIKVSHKADNQLINVEELTEKEIAEVKQTHKETVTEKEGN